MHAWPKNQCSMVEAFGATHAHALSLSFTISKDRVFSDLRRPDGRNEIAPAPVLIHTTSFLIKPDPLLARGPGTLVNTIWQMQACSIFRQMSSAAHWSSPR